MRDAVKIENISLPTIGDNNETSQMKDDRRLVWNDEFSGNTLDMSKWYFHRTMNNPSESYFNDERHIRIEDNKLHLSVQRDNGKITNCEGLTTKYTMLFKYGYLEMRAKAPFRHGAWPSFWLLGNTEIYDRSIGWEPEIDIFEIFSSESRLSPNLHKWGYNGVHEMLTDEMSEDSRLFQFENYENLNNEFHTYGFLWTEEKMEFFIDGKSYYKVCIDEKCQYVSEVFPNADGFHQPLYICINNEIFTDKLSWYPKGSAITDEDEFPIDYYIDWIRLYQNDDEKLYDKSDLDRAMGKTEE